MPIQTAAGRNGAISGYTAIATHASVYTTAAGATAGTEVTGGAPAFARKPLTWSAPNGTTSTTTPAPIFDIPASTTVVAAGTHTALTVGTYLDGGAVTSQTFSSQGTLTVTIVYTQA